MQGKTSPEEVSVVFRIPLEGPIVDEAGKGPFLLEVECKVCGEDGALQH